MGRADGGGPAEPSARDLSALPEDPAGGGEAGPPVPPAGRAFWLRFQLLLAAGGIGAWLAGAALDEPFLAGVGVGVLASGLAIRFVRARAGPREGPGADRA